MDHGLYYLPGRKASRFLIKTSGIVCALLSFKIGFERATGPKTEWWLVQTVGVLVTVVGAVLLWGARSERVTPELRGLGAAGTPCS